MSRALTPAIFVCNLERKRLSARSTFHAVTNAHIKKSAPITSEAPEGALNQKPIILFN